MFGIENHRARTSLRKHVENFFLNHTIHKYELNHGPIVTALPHFSVLEIAPGPKLRFWTYISLGAYKIRHEERGALEFMLVAPERNKQHLDTLAMVAYYHRNNQLGVGHTFPIGEPWLNGSKCDYILVSKPYVYGPEFEICNLSNRHIHILWLIPITKSERDFKSENGLEALEKLLEEFKLEYWNIGRESLI